MWFRAFKKCKPGCFAPQAPIGPAFFIQGGDEGLSRLSFALRSAAPREYFKLDALNLASTIGEAYMPRRPA
jgi:hypothetical protein